MDKDGAFKDVNVKRFRGPTTGSLDQGGGCSM
jgi:hypothetical protein